MNPLVKGCIVIAVVLMLAGGATAWRASVYADGKAAGRAEVQALIDKQNADIARLNKQVVDKDHEVIAAKEEDKEKIVTVYRTIREQLEPEIVEKPVYRDCRVTAGVLRGLVAAAEGRVPADPEKPADDPAGKAASTGR